MRQAVQHRTVSEVSRDILRTLVCAASPAAYSRSLGINPFEWQADFLDDPADRIILNGARQSGKSTVVSALPAHQARFVPGSLSLVLGATEKQAILDMRKIKDYIALDKDFPEIVRMGQDEIELSNRSIIAVVPATERSARGYSKPNIVLVDEGSRVDDSVYTSGVMPFFTDNAYGRLIVLSTPDGRQGFFARAFESKSWRRYDVFAPYDVDDQGWRLTPTDGAARRARMGSQGVRSYLSPRHANLLEQQFNLEQMGPLMYRQEYMAEFVEPEDQVFDYDDVEFAFGQHDIKPFYKQSIKAPEGWEVL